MNFIVNESAQKLRGGYYTPSDLAVFLLRWISEISPQSLLEPSCGDGAFFRAIGEIPRLRETKVTGFELDSAEAAKARRAGKAAGLDLEVKATDFLRWANESIGRVEPFDVVAGNPPFIRYQYLPKEFQLEAEGVFKKLGLPFTKHTNAWVPFVLASIALLRPGGRLALVVPSEIVHVLHAQALRTFIAHECRRVVVVDPQELWFEGTLQGAVLLMAEKRSSSTEASEGLGIYSVVGRDFLRLPPSQVFAAPQCINGKSIEGKWTHALLNQATRNLMDELMENDEVFRFRDVAKVDVGIVTGANKFFLVTDDVVADHHLERFAHPMFGRSEHCPGVIYNRAQHTRNAKHGDPTNFIWFPKTAAALPTGARAYVKLGEKENYHKRYKCRVRTPWYSVPSVYSTEIGMLKRSHDTPRLILNRLGAYTTDTAYRITSHRESAKRLVACFLNPLTALSAELEGRHYGGGVLELVPSEIERLAIALPKSYSPDIKSLDSSVREAHVSDVLESHGGGILAALGLSRAKREELLNQWDRLRRRRHRISQIPCEESEAY